MLSPEVRAAWAAANEQLVKDIREVGHATSGNWLGRQALLLTTTGAKSGEERMSPLAYSKDGARYIVTASKGGAPTHPGWYHNLLKDPVATIEVNLKKFKARASTAEGVERERLWLQHIALHPGIGEYPSKTTRVIPVVILDPIP
ncbi:MAG: nitroreductase family deazaflavin-dependent oxidoreductase [Chloroflexota bacterium]